MRASVVIANYNNAKFINDCINSLKSQTYNDIEIIFFDDNSQDNSLLIFPEGTRSKNLKLQKGFNGAALIAIDTESIILPISISGSEKPRMDSPQLLAGGGYDAFSKPP